MFRKQRDQKLGKGPVGRQTGKGQSATPAPDRVQIVMQQVEA